MSSAQFAAERERLATASDVLRIRLAYDFALLGEALSPEQQVRRLAERYAPKVALTTGGAVLLLAALRRPRRRRVIGWLPRLLILLKAYNTVRRILYRLPMLTSVRWL